MASLLIQRPIHPPPYCTYIVVVRTLLPSLWAGLPPIAALNSKDPGRETQEGPLETQSTPPKPTTTNQPARGHLVRTAPTRTSTLLPPPYHPLLDESLPVVLPCVCLSVSYSLLLPRDIFPLEETHTSSTLVGRISLDFRSCSLTRVSVASRSHCPRSTFSRETPTFLLSPLHEAHEGFYFPPCEPHSRPTLTDKHLTNP